MHWFRAHTVGVRSTIGKSSTFYVLLPQSARPAMRAPETTR
jgi:hypothetical protein